MTNYSPQHSSDYTQYLDASLEAAREQVALEEPSQGLTDYQQEFIAEARVFETAITSMFREAQNIGQGILAGLWHVHLNGLIQYLGEYNPDNDLSRWATDKFEEYASARYINQLCGVTTTLFPDVYAKSVQGKPYLDTFGNPVTVESLIEQNGVLNKLLTISFAYSQVDDSGREQLLSAVRSNRRRSDIESLRDTLLGKETMTFNYRTIPHGETVDIVFPNLTQQEWYTLRTLIGKVSEETFS